MNMDCSTFRLRKMADPAALDASMRQHLMSCTPCQRAAAAVDALEVELRRTIEVPLPPDLAWRIIERQRGGYGKRALWQHLVDGVRNPRPRWLQVGAVAAMIVVAAGALLSQSGHRAMDPATRAVIAHVASEPAVAFHREAVQPFAVAEAFARLGGRLDGALGEVRYLGTCILDGKEVQHLLVQMPEGQAQLVLLPGEPTDALPQSDAGWTAVVIPLKRGSLGIVTRSPDSVLRMRDRVARAVRVEG